MKRILSLILVFALMFGTMGCQQQAPAATESNGDTKVEGTEQTTEATTEEKTKLTLYTYYADNGKVRTDYALDKLAIEYPNVEIEVMHRNDGTGTELKTMAAVGNLPDMYEIPAQGTIEVFSKSGDIANLTDLLEENGVYDIVSEGALDYKKSPDGNIYAIEYIAPQTFLVYYNEDLFAEYGVEVPTNYDEFLEVVKTFESNGIIPLALFASESWPGAAFYDMLVTRREPLGVQGLAEGKTSPTDEAYLLAAQEYAELVNAGMIGKSAFATNASQAIEYFKTGKAAMFSNGSWFLGNMPQLGENFSYISNPVSVPGMEEATYFQRSGGSAPGGMALNPNSENLELATEILFKYTQYRHEGDVALNGIINPFNYDIPFEGEVHKSIAKYVEEMPSIDTKAYIPQKTPDDAMKTGLFDATQSLIGGVLTPEEFIEELVNIYE